MRQPIAAGVTLAAAFLLAFPAQAQSGLTAPAGDPGAGIAAVRSFLPVEAQYAAAIQKSGPKGFAGETAPGFVIRHGRDRWTGAAAFAQVDSWLHGLEGGKVAVTVRRLTLTGKTAVVLTREVITFPPVQVEGHPMNGSGTWYWKQTWQRTGQGWKIAVLEAVSEKELGPTPPLQYTVTADGRPAR